LKNFLSYSDGDLRQINVGRTKELEDMGEFEGPVKNELKESFPAKGAFFVLLGLAVAGYFVLEDICTLWAWISGEHQCNQMACFRTDTVIKSETIDGVRQFWFCPIHFPATGYPSALLRGGKIFLTVFYWVVAMGCVGVIIEWFKQRFSGKHS